MNSTDQSKPSGKVLLLILICVCICPDAIHGQISGSALIGAGFNAIQTAVPFLTIAPDARAAGMGDQGVASSPDLNSQHWNAAKYAFTDEKAALGISYSPWLREVLPNVNHLYLTAYYKLNQKNVISSSIRYLSLGNIWFPASVGSTATQQYHPYEFAVDAGFSRRLSDQLSGSLVLRYIHSNLTGGIPTPSGMPTSPGTSLAADLGVYYQNEFFIGSKSVHWALGTNLSNMGTSMAYSSDAPPAYIPANMRMGGRITGHLNDKHQVSIGLEFNKLMVPTPPVMDRDPVSGDMIIIRGKAAPQSVPTGILQSFYDAPGLLRSDGSYDVLREELHEITIGTGLEYKFISRYVSRIGYFHEHPVKGNRKFLTLGIGATFKSYSIDISYLKRLDANFQLDHTIRITLQKAFTSFPKGNFIS